MLAERKDKYTWLSKETVRLHYMAALIFWLTCYDRIEWEGRWQLQPFCTCTWEEETGSFQNRKLGQMGMVHSLALVPYFQHWKPQFKSSCLEMAMYVEYRYLQWIGHHRMLCFLNQSFRICPSPLHLYCSFKTIVPLPTCVKITSRFQVNDIQIVH